MKLDGLPLSGVRPGKASSKSISHTGDLIDHGGDVFERAQLVQPLRAADGRPADDLAQETLVEAWRLRNVLGQSRCSLGMGCGPAPSPPALTDPVLPARHTSS